MIYIDLTTQVANELAAANISVILTGTRPAPASWETKDSLVGPPLTRSPASILSEAGVHYAVAVAADGKEAHFFDILSGR